MTALEVPYPEGITEQRFKRAMVQALRCCYNVKFPLRMPAERTTLSTLRCVVEVQLAAAVLERQLTEALRFEQSGVYTVSAGADFGRSTPLVDLPMQGCISVRFECDPARLHELIALTLERVERSRHEDARVEQVSSMVESFQLNYQEQLRTNAYWVEAILSTQISTRSEAHGGAVAATYLERTAQQEIVWSSATPKMLREVLHRVVDPLHHRTSVIMEPV